MKDDDTIPLNTLEFTLERSRSLAMALRREARARRHFQIFQTMAADRFEALVAYVFWRVRGELMTELRNQERPPTNSKHRSA